MDYKPSNIFVYSLQMYFCLHYKFNELFSVAVD